MGATAITRDLNAREVGLLRYVAEAPRTRAEMRAHLGLGKAGGHSLVSATGPASRLARRLLIARAGFRGPWDLWGITQRGREELEDRRGECGVAGDRCALGNECGRLGCEECRA